MDQNLGKLEGKRVSLVMDFSPENGWFAMALFKMGARVKWASNDRLGGVKKEPDPPKRKKRGVFEEQKLTSMEEIDDEMAVI